MQNLVKCDARFEILQCTKCRTRLKRQGTNICFCNCAEYPIIEGIIYMKNDEKGKAALMYLKKGNIWRARKTIIGERLLLTIPINIFLISNFLDRLIKYLTTKRAIQLLGFENTIRLMTLFAYPRSWAKYLIDRKKYNTFQLTKKFLKTIKNPYLKLVDLGSGPGQLITYFLEKIKAENLYCIDDSYLNLLFAKNFFAKKKVHLICANLEDGLPFVDSKVNRIMATDSFFNINNKELLLNDSYRTLANYGSLIVIHTLNTTKKIFENIYGIKAQRICNLLRNNGFTKISIYEDNEILKNFDPDRLRDNYINQKLKTMDYYTFFAQK